ncbi:MAG: hypothetical protein ACREIC_29180, partial [Limisphaerales bacterium]
VVLPCCPSAMPRKFRTLLLALGVIVVLAIVSLMVFTAGMPASPPLPNPNGYDDFVKASGAVVGNTGDFPTLDRNSLAALVSTNAEPLRLLRVGLSRQCLMPMDFALTNAAGMMNQLAEMKRLVQLLAAEGRLREIENRPGDAARSYTDAIRFGNEMSRGGFLITRLVGIACESIGCHALAKVVPKLSREDARIVLTDLEKVDADHVSWAEVLRGEKYYVRYQLRHRLNPILWVMSWWQTREAMERAETKHKIVVAHERLLAGELALRSYQSAQGRAPARLDDLVTNYLSTVPQDPFTGRPFIYRSQGTNWLLYSVGPDGIDDGGRPAGRGWPVKGDILFDSSW